MKLTGDEIHAYNTKKNYYHQTHDDMAIGLGVDSFKLYLAVNGAKVSPEVLQAIREWIA